MSDRSNVDDLVDRLNDLLALARRLVNRNELSGFAPYFHHMEIDFPERAWGITLTRPYVSVGAKGKGRYRVSIQTRQTHMNGGGQIIGEFDLDEAVRQIVHLAPHVNVAPSALGNGAVAAGV